jgi:hypothetical protein
MAISESVPEKNFCQRGSDRTMPAPPRMGASFANVLKNSRREIMVFLILYVLLQGFEESRIPGFESNAKKSFLIA